ncbi:hypothetical protein [Halobaculum magnesiiphilum]|uniref:Uncharacterized protein n=1 Tax=Halobaculum magnesiiphilum TaxID=1017351 RepID=A0A8T8WEQ7_9EURY|nr:hypothetical protein [Halobaculum magnesiiphilum]QZP38214.1 hypothetical protein K6T50_03390 [Halobaculum magnesiiphilum]
MTDDRTTEREPGRLERVRERARAAAWFTFDMLRGHARSRHLDNREK